jgi:hypothetical protein
MGQSAEPVGSHSELTFSIVILLVHFKFFFFVFTKKVMLSFNHQKHTSCIVTIKLNVYTKVYAFLSE